MATLTAQTLTTASLTATFTAAAAAGDEFINDGHTVIYVKNADAATRSVVVASQFSPVPKGLAVANCTIDIAASTNTFCGFFNQRAYNDSSGMVQMTYASESGLSIAVVSVT